MSGSVIRASAVLRRRVKLGEEGRTGSGDGVGVDDAYWAAAPRLYDFSKHDEMIKREREQPEPEPESQPEPEVEREREPGPPPCLLTSLIQSGGVGWALRKRVRFINRRPARRCRSTRRGADRGITAAAVVETAPAEAVVVDEADEGSSSSSSNGKKRGRPAEQEEESGQDECKVDMTEKTKRKRKAGRGWGFSMRRRLPKKMPPPPPKEVNTVAEDSAQSESKVVMTEKKKNWPDEAESEESGRDERKVVAVDTFRRRKRKPVLTAETPKKTQRVEAEVAVGSQRAMVERWTAERYATAEACLLGILRDRGARASRPMPRGKLRQEVRKHVGDTGLLDHLLKHVAGRVTPDGAERMRRRHNADGGMEYWLEPAGLEALRREAGVEDPYWVPPPGWKPGDPVSPDACALEVKRQMEVLSAELAGVKNQMEQLMKNAAHQDQATLNREMKCEICIADYHQPYQEDYHCRMKANANLEKQVMFLEEKYEIATSANGKLEEEVLFLKEKYEAVVEKNSRMEEQMALLCTSFLSLKEDLLLLNVEEDCKDGKLLEGNAGGGAGDGMATASSTGGGSGSGKRMSRKCSVRICKPQGTFQWPPDATQPSSPVTPTTAAGGIHGYAMAGGGGGFPPTPPSVSSTKSNAASAKLPLLPPPPPPLPLATKSPSKDVLHFQAPRSGLELQLRRHTDTSSSSSAPAPCGATVSLPGGKKTALSSLANAAGGGSMGTELALATYSY